MGRLYKFSLFIIRCFSPRYRYQGPDEAIDKAVYVVHHQNLRGPITVMAWFPKQLRIWSLSVFFSRQACFRHFMDYTLTKRLGLPRILAYMIVWPISAFIPCLIKSTNAIPVYRNRKAVKTFRESIAALTNGQSLLICPDVGYTDTSNTIGEIYSGFLNLEKYYYKKTGQHLAFIPLYVNRDKGIILQGKAIFFSGQDDFKKEKSQIAEKLRFGINQLAELESCILTCYEA